jgi:hypothetical protein
MSEPEVAQPKPKKRFALLRKILLGLVLLVVIGLGVGRIMLPGIIRGQVEKLGTQYLQTDVKLGSVSLSLLSGSATLHDFSIKSYDGFSRPTFVTFKEAGANVSLSSLMSDTIVVDRVFLKGAETNLEIDKEGRKNVTVLLAKLEESTKKQEKKNKEEQKDNKDDGKDKEEESAPVGVIINEIALDDVTVNFLDQYSRDGEMASAVSLKKFTIDNIVIPAAGKKAGAEIMTIGVDDFRMTAPEGFTKRDFVIVPTLGVKLDLGTMMDTLLNPEIIINEVTHSGLELVAEDTADKPTDDATPENIRQFLHVAMNTATLDKPRHYVVMKDEKQSTDWYAVMSGNSDGTGESKDKKEKKDKKDKKQERAEPSEEASEQPADKPAEEPTPEPAEQSAGMKVFRLLSLQMDKMRFELIRPNEKRAKSIVLADTVLTIKNLVYPYEEGSSADLTLTTIPQDNPSKIELTASGALTDTRPERQTKATLVVTQLPLGIVPKIKSGVFTSKASVETKNEKAEGFLTFNLRNFDADKFGGVADQVMPMVELASKLELPEVKVPFSVSLKNKTWKETWKEFLKQLLSGLPVGLDGAVAATGKVLDDAGKQALEAGKAVSGTIGDVAGAATDAAGAATDAAKDAASGAVEGGTKVIEGATGGVKDATKSVGDGVKGIFGGKKKDPAAEPTPEPEKKE